MNYICIEGNIGAGKTTFANRYASLTGRTLILEEFDQNPFLESFYKQPEKHAFPLEMSFLAERFKQLNDLFTKPGLFDRGYIADYTFLKTMIFAEITLTQEEFFIFKKFYGLISRQLPKPDLVLYLDTPSTQAHQNIHARNRSMELDITLDYLAKIENAYKSKLLKSDYNVIVTPYDTNSWSNMDDVILKIEDSFSKKNR